MGKRYTLEEDTADPEVIKRILYKLSELIARRLRRKNLVGKTVHCFFRYSFDYLANPYSHYFLGSGGQTTIQYTDDGYKLFIAAWQLWQQLWDGRKIRMIGASVSSLKPRFPKTLTLLPNEKRWERLTAAIDAVNDRFGEFTVSRALAPSEEQVRHQPNPFLADERFKFDIS